MPCAARDADFVFRNLERAEDLPREAMLAGIHWNWETFPEFLDALEAGRRDIDVAAYLPHSPLRVFAMGTRGADREAANSDASALPVTPIVRQGMRRRSVSPATRSPEARRGRSSFRPAQQIAQLVNQVQGIFGRKLVRMNAL